MIIVNVLLFAIVAIVTICIINVGLYFVSMASTIANICGALLIICWACVLCMIIRYLLNK